MDRIEKFLSKRTEKERSILMAAINLIARNEWNGLDVKKLKGFKKLFRVRVGNFRIIAEKGSRESYILKIDERDDQTYRI